MFTRHLIVIGAALAITSPAPAQLPSLPKKVLLDPHTRTQDVIYHRKDGVALTMDVFTPQSHPNQAGIIMCVSAEYRSGKDMLNGMVDYATGVFLNRGYVVFMVCHGSQPRFTVPEIVDDMHRAVRFIKANAKDFKVDPGKLGITGASSGGQLCLMMGCDGKLGDGKTEVEKQSSRVAAVACIFPVTDFRAFENAPPDRFDATVLFPFRERDPVTDKLVLVSPQRRHELGVACSPLLCVRKEAAPTLIIHGDADNLVPIKQSRDLRDGFDRCGAICELQEVKGMGHSVVDALRQLPKLAVWFDKHLLDKK